AGRSTGYDFAALTIQMLREQQHGGIFQAAGLGLALDHHADAARRAGPGHDRRAVAGNLLSAWRVRRARCIDDESGVDWLQRGSDRANTGEDTRAGFLRTAEHPNPGEDRHHHAIGYAR